VDPSSVLFYFALRPAAKEEVFSSLHSDLPNGSPFLFDLCARSPCCLWPFICPAHSCVFSHSCGMRVLVPCSSLLWFLRCVCLSFAVFVLNRMGPFLLQFLDDSLCSAALISWCFFIYSRTRGPRSIDEDDDGWKGKFAATPDVLFCGSWFCYGTFLAALARGAPFASLFFSAVGRCPGVFAVRFLPVLLRN